MSGKSGQPVAPSINSLLSHADALALSARYGREPVRDALRREAGALWPRPDRNGERVALDAEDLIAEAATRLEAERRPGLRRVLNLTGTVLHTNLGRAPLPQEAVEAISSIALGASNLEYDLGAGKRGDRDRHVEDWLVRLTGAEAATVVNNNAAAVLLVVNTLARRREIVVSRGELVEIGSSFRLPDIMSAAGAAMREVGTTNRTRPQDYSDALTSRTAAVMRVHASNYRIEGFTEAASDNALGEIAAEAKIPFVIDLGAGSLVDLSRLGLPREPTPRDAIAAGASIVTFSGDKLLGGPQAGLIVGSRELVARIKRNPLKRALRCDKMTIAALASILPLHADAEVLRERLPAMRLLTRPCDAIAQQAQRLAPGLSQALDGLATVDVVECRSQIGSGAMPSDLLPSAGLRLTPTRGRITEARLAAVLRGLDTPVIGRLEKRALLLDLRCLEDDAELSSQFQQIAASARGAAS